MNYNWEKHNRDLGKLLKRLEEKSYEGDRTDRDYIMEEPRPMNYGEIKPDENGLWPEETLILN